MFQPDSTGFGESFFLDEMTGWIPYATGLSTWTIRRGLLHTSDGGQTWDSIATPGPGIQKVFFSDINHGWYYSGGAGSVNRTSDGGKTWENMETSFPRTQSSVLTPRTLHFYNADTGWAGCDYALLLKTTDRGNTWLSESPPGNGDYWRYFSDIFFIGETHGWAVGGYRDQVLARTTDGGTTWIGNHLNPKIGCCELRAVSFGNREWGIAVGRYFTQTIDGGRTWIRLDSFGLAQWKNRIFFTDVDLVDSSYGWVSGFYYDSAAKPLATFVCITSDRGETWEAHEFPSVPESVGISATSRSSGFLVGRHSVWRYELRSGVRDRRSSSHFRLDLRP